MRILGFKVILAVLLTQSVALAQQSGTALLERLGYPKSAKLLIIHADDIGMSHSVNVASFEALQKGWVSSGSIMAPCPWFNEAAEFARQHPEVDLGLHLTLTSEWQNYRWGPVTRADVPSLLDAGGLFARDTSGIGTKAVASEAAGEIATQVARAKSAGIRFTHLDNHMGALSQNAALFRAYIDLGRSVGVPMSFSRGEVSAYAGAVDLRELPMPMGLHVDESDDLLQRYREKFSALGPGVYIMVVHLGYDDPELRAIMKNDAGTAAGRQRDYDLVSNPEFQRILRENAIKLIGWKDLTEQH